jgi:hypothetical protein
MIYTVSRVMAARFMGMKGSAEDPRVTAMIEDAITLLQKVCVPRHIVSRQPVAVTGDTVQIGPLTLISASLARLLAPCGEGLLIAATLGIEADAEIRKASVTEISRAAALQACAGAMLEGYLDAVNEVLSGQAAREGLRALRRFSPGYGGLSLSCQRELLTLLGAPRAIGLTATDAGMLAPTKSVTAIIGLARGAQGEDNELSDKE